MQGITNVTIGENVDYTTTNGLLDRLQQAVGVYPFDITYSLTNCSVDEQIDTATEYSSLTLYFTPDSLYDAENPTVTITMGGVDITSTAYSYDSSLDKGVVTIASVTGDIDISITCALILDTTYAIYGAQELVIPRDGYYKLEAWGAQGGTVNSAAGGFGGYSYGTTYLTKNTMLYINVGSAGQGAGNTSLRYGGYNGGGNKPQFSINQTVWGGSGGGASHIAYLSGTLSTLRSYNESILIVAGGGGGGVFDSYNGSGYAGGNGGGTTGKDGLGVGSSIGKGATQSSPGMNGTGAASPMTSSGFGQGGGSPVAGGGGGFYGGGAGNFQSHTAFGAGGGGIGYLSSSLTNSGSINSGTASISPTSNCLKSANGACRIQYVGNSIQGE